MKPPPLSVPTKLAFGVGSASESIFYIAFNLFCFFYYVQVLGLPGSLAGFAAAIALLFDAVSDPLAGYISDRWRWGRIGRRHPMMFLSVVPLGLSWSALFAPPDDLGQWTLFFWLLCFSVLARISQTIFYVPHIAMGSELADSYVGRSRVFSWHVIFLWAGGAAVHFLGLRVFFASEKDADGEVITNGMLVAENYPIYGVCWALVMVAVILYSAFFTMSRIPYLNANRPAAPRPVEKIPRLERKTPRPEGKISRLEGQISRPEEKIPVSLWSFLAGTWTELAEVLHNRNYRLLVMGLFVQAIGAGVFETLQSHAINYLWQLTTEQYSTLAFASLVGFAMGFVFIARLHAVVGKRLTLAVAMVFMSAGNAVPMGLLLLGVPVEPGSDMAYYFVFGGAVSYYIGQSAVLGSIVSVIGDIADEHDLNTGKRREGVLFSSRTFFAKLSSALGHMVAGFLLTVITFPLGKDVRPGDVPEDVLHQFMWVYVTLIPIPPLIAALFYLQQRITKQRHEEIVEQLRLRNAHRQT